MRATVRRTARSASSLADLQQGEAAHGQEDAPDVLQEASKSAVLSLSPEKVNSPASSSVAYLTQEVPLLATAFEIVRLSPGHGPHIMPPSELCRIDSRGQPCFLSIAGCRSPAMLD